MNHCRQTRLLNHVVSPYGLAIISFALFFFSWILPPSIYSHFVNEPDKMFLDPGVMLFYLLCVASFVAGLWIVGWIAPAPFLPRKLNARISPTLVLVIPLFIGIAGTLLTIYLLIKQVPNIFVLLISQQGGELKETLSLDLEGNFGFAPLALTGVAWWAFWRSSELNLQGWRKRLVSLSIGFAATCVIAASTIMLLRDMLMIMICGLIILFVMRVIVRKQMSRILLFKFGLVFSLAISFLFMTFSFLRGTDGLDEQVRSLMGYTIASYNRLAAVVNGDLRYPLAGRGVYLSYAAAYGHALNLVLPIGKIIDPPQFLDLWSSEFGAVSRAGLDGTLIWPGAFGYIFSELHWLSCFFVFGYGLLNGVVWRWMKIGTVSGIVLYPYCAFCTLTWFGTNSLLNFTAESFVAVAIFIALYERIFLKST
jgi:hypothetical protein